MPRIMRRSLPQIAGEMMRTAALVGTRIVVSLMSAGRLQRRYQSRLPSSSHSHGWWLRNLARAGLPSWFALPGNSPVTYWTFVAAGCYGWRQVPDLARSPRQPIVGLQAQSASQAGELFWETFHDRCFDDIPADVGGADGRVSETPPGFIYVAVGVLRLTSGSTGTFWRSASRRPIRMLWPSTLRLVAPNRYHGELDIFLNSLSPAITAYGLRRAARIRPTPRRSTPAARNRAPI